MQYMRNLWVAGVTGAVLCFLVMAGAIKLIGTPGSQPDASGIQTQVEAMAQKATANLVTADKLEAATSTLRSELTGLVSSATAKEADDITAANARMDTHDARLTAVEGRVTAVEAAGKTAADTVAALDSRVQTLEAKPAAQAAPGSTPEPATSQTSLEAEGGNLPATAEANSQWFSVPGMQIPLDGQADYASTSPEASPPKDEKERVTWWMDRLMKCHFDPSPDSQMDTDKVAETPDEVLQKLYDGCKTEEQYQASLATSQIEGTCTVPGTEYVPEMKACLVSLVGTN